MQHETTFTGWDFVGTWLIVEGETRPYLRWQRVVLFEGPCSGETPTGFTVDEGYVYNRPRSGVIVTEYGFVVREEGSLLETFYPVTGVKSLGANEGVPLDGTVVEGLTGGTTYLYRAYASDDDGVIHYGTERSVTLPDPCDVDGNGKVDAVDVQLVINAVLALRAPYDCDVNDDGKLDAIDVQLVINAALGL